MNTAIPDCFNYPHLNCKKTQPAQWCNPWPWLYYHHTQAELNSHTWRLNLAVWPWILGVLTWPQAFVEVREDASAFWSDSHHPQQRTSPVDCLHLEKKTHTNEMTLWHAHFKHHTLKQITVKRIWFGCSFDYKCHVKHGYSHTVQKGR